MESIVFQRQVEKKKIFGKSELAHHRACSDCGQKEAGKHEEESFLFSAKHQHL